MSVPKVLTILEVSRKQDYIFGAKELKENVRRSAEIAYVTSSPFFEKTAPAFYKKENNLVYAGGGHTVLQFDSREQAVEFARAVTEAAVRQFNGMEIFVRTLPYDPSLTPGQNLTALSAALEEKKARRQASFRWMDAGVACPKDDADADEQKKKETIHSQLEAPAGWRYLDQFEKIAGNDSFIAVVHIDGNAMGKRVMNLYQDNQGDWDQCRQSLQRFSESIQKDFEQSMTDTAYALIAARPDGLEAPDLPLRPVILAGDDVCFVCQGSWGLECARLFLEHLTDKINAQDDKSYAACAGVALVHTKYPFHAAYDLAEQLCSSAKKFGASIDAEGRVSAMDWHIEYGQLKDTLGEIRADYATEDGGRMELRPVVVLAGGVDEAAVEQQTGKVRSWRFFRALSRELQQSLQNIPRSKLKELRTALKQGELETEFAIQNLQISDLLYQVFNAKYDTLAQQMNAYRQGNALETIRREKTAFQEVAGVKRCLFFDAIEMMDHCTLLEKEEAE